MALDLLVSQALTRLRALERALHGSGHWSIELDGMGFLADRFVRDDDVRFCAPIIGSWHGDYLATLSCGAEPVLTRTLRLDEEGPFVLEWSLSLDEPVRA